MITIKKDKRGVSTVSKAFGILFLKKASSFDRKKAPKKAAITPPAPIYKNFSAPSIEEIVSISGRTVTIPIIPPKIVVAPKVFAVKAPTHTVRNGVKDLLITFKMLYRRKTKGFCSRFCTH